MRKGSGGGGGGGRPEAGEADGRGRRTCEAGARPGGSSCDGRTCARPRVRASATSRLVACCDFGTSRLLTCVPSQFRRDFATSRLRAFGTSSHVATSELRNFATSRLRDFAPPQLRRMSRPPSLATSPHVPLPCGAETDVSQVGGRRQRRARFARRCATLDRAALACDLAGGAVRQGRTAAGRSTLSIGAIFNGREGRGGGHEARGGRNTRRGTARERPVAHR
jgi:hypothetical protein